MKYVILDCKEFSNESEFHNIIKEKLEFPDYYGCNLDALWDCLTGWVDFPLTIEWIGFEESKKLLGEIAVKIANIFNRLVNYEKEHGHNDFFFIKH